MTLAKTSAYPSRVYYYYYSQVTQLQNIVCYCYMDHNHNNIVDKWSEKLEYKVWDMMYEPNSTLHYYLLDWFQNYALKINIKSEVLRNELL